ncbi:MAG: hypothetical protein ACQETD_08370, partial [Pseudomonadota bacterium]
MGGQRLQQRLALLLETPGGLSQLLIKSRLEGHGRGHSTLSARSGTFARFVFILLLSTRCATCRAQASAKATTEAAIETSSAKATVRTGSTAEASSAEATASTAATTEAATTGGGAAAILVVDSIIITLNGITNRRAA